MRSQTVTTLISHPDEDKEEWTFAITATLYPYIPARTYGDPDDCYPEEGGDIEILSVKWDNIPKDMPKEEIKWIEEDLEQRIDDDKKLRERIYENLREETEIDGREYEYDPFEEELKRERREYEKTLLEEAW